MAYCGFIVALIAVASYFLLRPGKPAPSNNKVFGCYTTPNAAPILLNHKGMTIFQPTPIRINYHLERHKTGIVLAADVPIAAEPTGVRFTFSIRPPDEGWYFNFFNVIDGHSYGVLNEDQLKQFTVLALDGTYLRYRQASAKSCHS